MAEKIQAKFYVPSDVWKSAQRVMDAQGVDYSEGMTRLLRLLVDSPESAWPLAFGQVRGDVAKVLAQLVLATGGAMPPTVGAAASQQTREDQSPGIEPDDIATSRGDDPEREARLAQIAAEDRKAKRRRKSGRASRQ